MPAMAISSALAAAAHVQASPAAANKRIVRFIGSSPKKFLVDVGDVARRCDPVWAAKPAAAGVGVRMSSLAICAASRQRILHAIFDDCAGGRVPNDRGVD